MFLLGTKEIPIMKQFSDILKHRCLSCIRCIFKDDDFS